MLHSLKWWWIKGSSILVIFMIFLMFNGAQPLVTSAGSSAMNWASSIGIAITPVGAIMGYFVLFVFSMIFDMLLSAIGIESKPLAKMRKWTPAKETGLHFNSQSSYTGKTNEEGMHFDVNNQYTGKTNEEGMRFDKNNQYTGKTRE